MISCTQPTVMESDKENQQQVMLARKAISGENIGTPRTPFAAVNRKSAYMTGSSNVSQKSGQILAKPQGKRHSWAHEYQMSVHQLGQHESETGSTPVGTKDLREQSLRKRIIQMRGAGQLMEEEQMSQKDVDREQVAGTVLSCTLPPSPVLYLPSSETRGQCNPSGSASCPEVFANTHNQGTVCSTTATLTHSVPPCSAQVALMSSSPPVACQKQAEDVATAGITGVSAKVAKSVDPAVSDFVLSADETETGVTIVSQDIQAEVIHVETGSQGFTACGEVVQTSLFSETTDFEMRDAVQIILEQLVTDVLNEVSQSVHMLSPERHGKFVGTDGSVATSCTTEVALQVDSSQSPYMAEYSRFVAAYIREKENTSQLTSDELHGPAAGSNHYCLDSPSSVSGASSETDVTSSSIVTDADADQSSGSVSESQSKVILGSLGSFLLDANESLSNTDCSRQQLAETLKSSRYRSQGFVRSSVSRFDLTQESEDTLSPWKSLSEESVDHSESLNLSVSDQRVVYFVSPPLAAAASEDSASCNLTRHGRDAETSTDSVALSPLVVSVGDHEAPTQGTVTEDANTMTGGVEISMAVSPLPVSLCEKETVTDAAETTEADTVTLAVDVNTVGLSPLSVSVCEWGVTTDSVEVTHTNTMTVGVDVSTVVLLPMQVPVHEKQTETDMMSVSDADTMILGVQTYDVALSPVAVAVHDVNTMTASPERAEVAMGMETLECLDHSMLAVTEMLHKATMTDTGSTCHAHTCMTPLKVLAKQAHRLTSDDIRKQHPRTLANQLETLTLCNSRLETELKSAQQEQLQLKTALKQARVAQASVRKEMAEAELAKEKEWAQKEHQYQEQISKLEQQVAESMGRVATLELEASNLKKALETATKQHMQDMADQETKCQGTEEHRLMAAQQYEHELQELRMSLETNSYRQRFELAQQLVREREAELVELRAVFVDLQDTAHRQEQVNEAFQGIHDKVMALARENMVLKETLHKQRVLSWKERDCQQAEVSVLEEQIKSMEQEVDNLKHMLELNNTSLSELEKLYAGASSDLLAATSQVIQLNSELGGARKAMQELLLSKEGLAKRASELEDELEVVQCERASLTETLTQAQDQLQQQTKACEDLKKLNTKIKHMYEEKFENLELGIENLQRTLDNREADIDNLEKDLYECRNIIVEQRYKIDGLEAELRESREEVAKRQSQDEDVQFFKESNTFLEAERALYVESLRDLEQKLKEASFEVSRQQQMASDAQCLVTQLEKEKCRLRSQLSQTQNQLSQSSHALTLAETEHARAESVAIAAASELLQKMQTVLNGLKRKVGMREMPEASASPAYQYCHTKAPSTKHRCSIRKSFVSKILGAAFTSSPVKMEADDGSRGVDAEGVHRNQSEGDRHNTSDVLAVMNASGDATGTGASLFAALDSLSPDKVSAGQQVSGLGQESGTRDLSFRGLGLTASDLAMAYSLTRDGDCGVPAPMQKSVVKNADSSSVSGQPRPASVINRRAPKLAPSRSSAFTAVPRSSASSSFLDYSFPPPPPEPPTSAVAKIRTLPRTERCSAPAEQSAPAGHSAPTGNSAAERAGGLREDMMSVNDSGFLTCVLSLEEVFVDISHLASILDRATQFALQDLREENDLLRERTLILQDAVHRSWAEMDISRQEAANLELTISQAQECNRQMTDRLMALADHKEEVKRLSGEVKSLQGEVEAQRREKELLATELEMLLKRLETSACDGGSVQARCMRDIITLKKRNMNLLEQLGDQKDHYEELGRKAARRMCVLEENWRKAEDEVYRFDELVENIRWIAESRTSSPASSMMRILQVINGGINTSPV